MHFGFHHCFVTLQGDSLDTFPSVGSSSTGGPPPPQTKKGRFLAGSPATAKQRYPQTKPPPPTSQKKPPNPPRLPNQRVGSKPSSGPRSQSPPLALAAPLPSSPGSPEPLSPGLAPASHGPMDGCLQGNSPAKWGTFQ